MTGYLLRMVEKEMRELAYRYHLAEWCFIYPTNPSVRRVDFRRPPTEQKRDHKRLLNVLQRLANYDEGIQRKLALLAEYEEKDLEAKLHAFIIEDDSATLLSVPIVSGAFVDMTDVSGAMVRVPLADFNQFCASYRKI